MTVYKWSQTAASNDTADSSINWLENQAPSTLNNSARAMMAAVAKLYSDMSGKTTTGGTLTAYTITSAQSLSVLTDGYFVRARMHVASGSAPTLNVDSTGAKAIQSGGAAISVGKLVKNAIYGFTYSSSLDVWIVTGVSSHEVGDVIETGSASAPALSLLAYGQAISRTDYPALFTVYGTRFGSGDGSTTFNLPDLRGRVSAGADNMGGSSASRLTGGVTGSVASGAIAAVGGEESHQLKTAEAAQKSISSAPVTITDPGHTHLPSGANIAGNGSSFDVSLGGSSGRITSIAGFTLTSATTGISAAFSLSGSDAASVHNNVQPTIMMNKYVYAGA